MGDMKLWIAVVLLTSGCAMQKGSSLKYTAPGSCHFEYGTHYAVQYEDGSTRVVASSCETSEEVLRGRI